jgi:hypothetical protein
MVYGMFGNSLQAILVGLQQGKMLTTLIEEAAATR